MILEVVEVRLHVVINVPKIQSLEVRTSGCIAENGFPVALARVYPQRLDVLGVQGRSQIPEEDTILVSVIGPGTLRIVWLDVQVERLVLHAAQSIRDHRCLQFEIGLRAGLSEHYGRLVSGSVHGC